MDQQIATIFYMTGLGLTRDAYLMTGVENMWINVGRGQFHLPTRGQQVLRGTTALVVPDLEALLRRRGLGHVHPEAGEVVLAPAALEQFREEERIPRHVLHPDGQDVDPVVVAADPDVRRAGDTFTASLTSPDGAAVVMEFTITGDDVNGQFKAASGDGSPMTGKRIKG